MKNKLILLSFLIILIMTPFFLIQKNSTNNNKVLIVLFGESNSGGIALNSDATLGELAVRNLTILNNDNLIFEPLDIGVNNQLGHFGITGTPYQTTTHGMELEIANKYDDGYFGGKEVFLVKAGQGGSTVSEWQIGGSYFNTLKSRIDTALLAKPDLEVVFMLSIGINDSLAGTTNANYKLGLKTLIENLQSYYSFPINLKLMKFEFVTSPASNCYATQIQEVATELGMQTFSTYGCGVQADGNHLTYTGMKKAADNFLDSL